MMLIWLSILIIMVLLILLFAGDHSHDTQIDELTHRVTRQSELLRQLYAKLPAKKRKK